MSHFTVNTSRPYSSSAASRSLVVKVRGWGGVGRRSDSCLLARTLESFLHTAVQLVRGRMLTKLARLFLSGLQPLITVRDESCWSQLAQLAVELVNDGIWSNKFRHVGVDGVPVRKARRTQPH